MSRTFNGRGSKPAAPRKEDPAAREKFLAANGEVTISFTLSRAHAPALRSVVDEMSDTMATRLEGTRRFPQEAALTAAVIGLGALRAALHRSTQAGDPAYR